MRGNAFDLAHAKDAAVLSEPNKGIGRVLIRRVSDAAIFLIYLNGFLIFSLLSRNNNKND
jgi:hypothetical protein